MGKNLCVIPARGGSKRIPRKNIRDFLGKPIIAYSIKTALKAGIFDEVMVSTDDEEIAEIAEKYGAKVPFLRSEENSDDYATTIDVLREVHLWYKKNGFVYKDVCCLYPTAPLVTQNLLKKSYSRFKSINFDCLLPVAKYSFPVQRAMRIDPSGRISMIFPENLNKRSQDLEETFHDAGQFYWFKSGIIMDPKKLNKANTAYIEVNELEVQDIDSELDWKLAEIKYKLKEE